MSATLPLAEAARRLRGRPGRPCKRPAVPARPVTFPVTSPATPRHHEHSSSPQVHHTSGPSCHGRLLGVREAGEYLGVSPFTIRNMVRDGRLRAVPVPGLKRILVDRVDLDRLIEAWKVSEQPFELSSQPAAP